MVPWGTGNPISPGYLNTLVFLTGKPPPLSVSVGGGSMSLLCFPCCFRKFGCRLLGRSRFCFLFFRSLMLSQYFFLLFDKYSGHSMTIARKLCLQSCSHLRHNVLYVLRPLSFRNNDHSNFCFFDIRGIQPTS